MKGAGITPAPFAFIVLFTDNHFLTVYHTI